MNITVSGVAVSPVAGSLSLTDSIGQRSTGSVVLFDQFGTQDYVANQSVVITDDTALVIFSGFIESAKKLKPGFPATLYHVLTLKDQHFLADKRIVATSYSGLTCGAMASDIVTNWLAAEGVTAGSSVNLLTKNQSDVETNLTGFSTANSSLITGNVTATLTRDLTVMWQGLASAHVNTGAVTSGNSGVELSPGVAVGAGQQVTISFYYQTSSSGGALRVRDYTNSTGPAGLVLSTPTSGWQRATYTFTQAAATSDLRFCVRSSTQNQDIWLDGLQVEIGASATAWAAGGGTSTIQAGPIVTPHVVNYQKASKALDELAKLAGFYWYIDTSKVLHFVAPGTEVAPWAYDGSQAIDFAYPAEVESTAPLYRNAQYQLGATEVTSSQTETRKGDGTTRAFTAGYPMHTAPTAVHINAGANQTVGILGIDTGKQWYWNKGSPVLTQDNSGTILLSTDTLSYTYVGEYKVVAYSTDAAQIAAEQALEGGGSGLVEDVQSDASLVTSARAFQSANALLAKYGLPAKIVTFTTRVPGLAAGQVLSINLPDPWQLSGVQGLIESVGITYDDFSFLFAVTCIIGPVNSNWVQFFHALANQQGVIDLTGGGQSSTVALINTILAAWTWTATLTPVVVSCPLFPITFPKTLC